MAFFIRSTMNPNGMLVRDEHLSDDLEVLADEVSINGTIRPDRLEGMLDKWVDRPIAEAAKKIRAGESLTVEEEETCCLFISTAFCRGPAWIKSSMMRGMVEQRTRQVGIGYRNLYGIKGLNDSFFASVNQVLREAVPLIDMCKQVQRPALLNRSLYRLEVLVAPSSSSIGFAIGDNAGRPYSTYDDPFKLPRNATGIATAGAVITFPVGPKHCLRMYRKPGDVPICCIEVDEETVRRINTVQLMTARADVVYPLGNTDVFMQDASIDTSRPWSDP